MQTAHILNLVSRTGTARDSLDAELSRRRFWACYLINCHSTDSMFAISPSRNLAGLPLPWVEDEFEHGSSNSRPCTFGSGITNGGIYSEMIRAMTHWLASTQSRLGFLLTQIIRSSVNTLIKSFDGDTQARITAIHRLDAEIRKWWDGIPQNLHLHPSNLASFLRVDLTKLVLIHVVYYQCLCALHSSIVPLFSWGPDEPTHAVAQQLSAQLAYENASATSQFLQMILDFSHETADFPSFVGYAAYCSYAVQVPFRWCLNPSVRETALKNTRANLQVIQGMSKYWEFIVLLVWIRLLRNKEFLTCFAGSLCAVPYRNPCTKSTWAG